MENKSKLQEYLEKASKWSNKVKTKEHTPKGLFSKSAEEIAEKIISMSDSLQEAVSKVNFYINRAGSNLKNPDKFDKVKSIIHNSKKFKKSDDK